MCNGSTSFTRVCKLTIIFCAILIRSTELFGGGISGDGLTWNNLSFLETRIQKYAAEHHALPDKLSDLPEDPDYHNALTDGWDKPIAYDPQKDGSVILTSQGKNGGIDVRSHQFSIVSEDEHYNAEFWTFNHMDFTEAYIRDYAKAHLRLPESLAELPADQRGEYSIDGWGKPIEYKANTNGSITLTSRGKNGKQLFRNEFFVASFATTRPTTRSLK